MGLFSKKSKPNFGEIYQPPPTFSYAPGTINQYSGGLQGLIDTFTNRSQGNDIFDYVKYLFDPQAAALRQSYGIDTNSGDTYARGSGVLPQTLAGLNKRGLLDSGTSGVIEAQTRSNLENQLSQLFGTAKGLQRQDIDQSLEALNQLYPQRFQVGNMQTMADYQNAMNNWQQDQNRALATASYQQSQPSTFQQIAPILGQGISALFGGAGNIGSGIMSLFGGGNRGGGGFNQQSFQTSQPPQGYNFGFNPFGNVNKNPLSVQSSRGTMGGFGF